MIYPVPAVVCLVQNPNQRITLNLNNTPTRQALETLFKSAGVKSYAIEEGVTGTVTVSVKDLTFQSALAQVIQAASPAVTAFNLPSGQPGGSWVIKPNAAPANPLPQTQKFPPDAPWEKITLRYRTARELDPILGGISTPSQPPPKPQYVTVPVPAKPFNPKYPQIPAEPATTKLVPVRSLRPPGIDNIIALENGTLLVQGDSADIQELRALIQMLDIPVPSVECTLEVVRVSDAGKQSRNSLLAAKASGKVGTELKGTTKFSGTPAKTSRLDVTFKLTALSNDTYEVESRCEMSIPLATTVKGQLTRLEKTFSNTRQLKAGQTLMLDGMVLKEEQGAARGGEEVLFFLTIKPIQ